MIIYDVVGTITHTTMIMISEPFRTVLSQVLARLSSYSIPHLSIKIASNLGSYLKANVDSIVISPFCTLTSTIVPTRSTTSHKNAFMYSGRTRAVFSNRSTKIIYIYTCILYVVEGRENFYYFWK